MNHLLSSGPSEETSKSGEEVKTKKSVSIPKKMKEKKMRPLETLRSNATAMLHFSSRAIIVKAIFKIILKLIIKLWKWASSFTLFILLAAWFYGGFLPYILTFIAFLSLSYQLSDSFLYQPDTPAESRIFVPTPNNLGLPCEILTIHTKDRVKLQAFLIKQQRLNSRNIPTVIYFHGNAGNIGHRLENGKMFFYKLKCNLLLVEYRGYGHSEGIPSEKGFYLDSQAAFQYVEDREDLDSSKIILFGRSLGGAVAIDLASRIDFRDRIAALIVENTFTSIPNLARELFPFRVVKMLPKFCYKNKYDSYKKISQVICPALFISGLKDELVPPKMMNDLYQRCASSMKILKRYPEGSHNDTWLSKGYAVNLCEFVDEAIQTGHGQCQDQDRTLMDSINRNDNIV